MAAKPHSFVALHRRITADTSASRSWLWSFSLILGPKILIMDKLLVPFDGE
jgi:hypothetical protein